MRKFSYRVHFVKQGRVRFLSHHDLLRLFERAARRSGLPVAYSEGFNPRPRLSFPTALAVGIESRDEILEIALTEWVSPARVGAALGAQFPDGLSVADVDPVRVKDARRLRRVVYVARFLDVPPPAGDRIAAFLARTACPVVRPNPVKGDKTVDIRPFVQSVVPGIPAGFAAEGGPAAALTMTLFITDRGTARPEEVLEALGIPPVVGEAVPYLLTKVKSILE